MTVGRGLLRLWVVLSVCWVVAIGAITWSTFPHERWLPVAPWVRPRHANDVFIPDCPQPDPKVNQEVCSLDSEARVEAIKRGAVLAFAPPIGVLILGVAFAWVVKGFRSSK
jgi:hypothetical protein